MKVERFKFLFNKRRAGDSTLGKTWEEIDPAEQSSLLIGVRLEKQEVPVAVVPHAVARRPNHKPAVNLAISG